jgi:hypothetical protein
MNPAYGDTGPVNGGMLLVVLALGLFGLWASGCLVLLAVNAVRAVWNLGRKVVNATR